MKSNLNVAKVPLNSILPMRDSHRREMNCQILKDSWHERGLTDAYLLRVDGQTAGYGSVGSSDGSPREMVVEYYVVPALRGLALPLFQEFARLSRARTIEAQTNDRLLSLMFFDWAENIEAGKILFHDAITTNLSLPGAIFRKVSAADKARIFQHSVEPVGDWVIDCDSRVVATGGFLTHYNPPYADIFMEVEPSLRRRGIGGFLVQELKRTCREMGKVPAARCDPSNHASRAALQKAGMLPCARILRGLKRNDRPHR